MQKLRNKDNKTLMSLEQLRNAGSKSRMTKGGIPKIFGRPRNPNSDPNDPEVSREILINKISYKQTCSEEINQMEQTQQIKRQGDLDLLFDYVKAHNLDAAKFSDSSADSDEEATQQTPETQQRMKHLLGKSAKKKVQRTLLVEFRQLFGEMPDIIATKLMKLCKAHTYKLNYRVLTPEDQTPDDIFLICSGEAITTTSKVYYEQFCEEEKKAIQKRKDEAYLHDDSQFSSVSSIGWLFLSFCMRNNAIRTRIAEGSKRLMMKELFKFVAEQSVNKEVLSPGNYFGNLKQTLGNSYKPMWVISQSSELKVLRISNREINTLFNVHLNEENFNLLNVGLGPTSTRDKIRALSRCFLERVYPRGKILMKEGEVIDKVYLIKSGECQIYSDHNPLTFKMFQSSPNNPAFVDLSIANQGKKRRLFALGQSQGDMSRTFITFQIANLCHGEWVGEQGVGVASQEDVIANYSVRTISEAVVLEMTVEEFRQKLSTVQMIHLADVYNIKQQFRIKRMAKLLNVARKHFSAQEYRQFHDMVLRVILVLHPNASTKMLEKIGNEIQILGSLNAYQAREIDTISEETEQRIESQLSSQQALGTPARAKAGNIAVHDYAETAHHIKARKEPPRINMQSGGVEMSQVFASPSMLILKQDRKRLPKLNAESSRSHTVNLMSSFDPSKPSVFELSNHQRQDLDNKLSSVPFNLIQELRNVSFIEDRKLNMREDNERKKKLKSYRMENRNLPDVNKSSKVTGHSNRVRMTAYYNQAAADQQREISMNSPKLVFIHTRNVKRYATMCKDPLLSQSTLYSPQKVSEYDIRFLQDFQRSLNFNQPTANFNFVSPHLVTDSNQSLHATNSLDDSLASNPIDQTDTGDQPDFTECLGVAGEYETGHKESKEGLKSQESVEVWQTDSRMVRYDQCSSNKDTPFLPQMASQLSRPFKVKSSLDSKFILNKQEFRESTKGESSGVPLASKTLQKKSGPRMLSLEQVHKPSMTSFDQHSSNLTNGSRRMQEQVVTQSIRAEDASEMKKALNNLLRERNDGINMQATGGIGKRAARAVITNDYITRNDVRRGKRSKQSMVSIEVESVASRDFQSHDLLGSTRQEKKDDKVGLIVHSLNFQMKLPESSRPQFADAACDILGTTLTGESSKQKTESLYGDSARVSSQSPRKILLSESINEGHGALATRVVPLERKSLQSNSKRIVQPPKIKNRPKQKQSSTGPNIDDLSEVMNLNELGQKQLVSFGHTISGDVAKLPAQLTQKAIALYQTQKFTTEVDEQASRDERNTLDKAQLESNITSQQKKSSYVSVDRGQPTIIDTSQRTSKENSKLNSVDSLRVDDVQSRVAIDLFKPQMLSVDKVVKSQIESVPVQGSIKYKSKKDRKARKTEAINLPDIDFGKPKNTKETDKHRRQDIKCLKNIVEEVVNRRNGEVDQSRQNSLESNENVETLYSIEQSFSQPQNGSSKKFQVTVNPKNDAVQSGEPISGLRGQLRYKYAQQRMQIVAGKAEKVASINQTVRNAEGSGSLLKRSIEAGSRFRKQTNPTTPATILEIEPRITFYDIDLAETKPQSKLARLSMKSQGDSEPNYSALKTKPRAPKADGELKSINQLYDSYQSMQTKGMTDTVNNTLKSTDTYVQSFTLNSSKVGMVAVTPTHQQRTALMKAQMTKQKFIRIKQQIRQSSDLKQY